MPMATMPTMICRVLPVFMPRTIIQPTPSSERTISAPTTALQPAVTAICRPAKI